MKRITGLLTLSAISAVIFFACKKDLSNTNTGGSSDGAIQLSESIVSKNQPLQAALTTASDANWQVTPSEGVEIDAEGNEATFMFALPGSYTITATGNGAAASQAFVTVSNRRFNLADSSGGDTSHIDSSRVVPLTGDQITLKPVVANDSGLVLFSITQKRYQCRNNMLLYNTWISGGGTDSTGGGHDSTGVGHDTLSTQIAFTGVYIPSPSDCVSGMVRSKAFIYLPNYAPGTAPFSVVLNGKVYTGSITTTATYYQFNWPYTSGVIISPKKIARK